MGSLLLEHCSIADIVCSTFSGLHDIVSVSRQGIVPIGKWCAGEARGSYNDWRIVVGSWVE